MSITELSADWQNWGIYADEFKYKLTGISCWYETYEGCVISILTSFYTIYKFDLASLNLVLLFYICTSFLRNFCHGNEILWFLDEETFYLVSAATSEIFRKLFISNAFSISDFFVLGFICKYPLKMLRYSFFYFSVFTNSLKLTACTQIWV